MDGHPLILLKHGGPSRKKASLYGKVAQIYFALRGSFLLCAQHQIRPIALGRKNWLFAGSQRAGRRAAAVMSLIQSAKMNGHDPYAYVKDVLTRLPTHPNNRIDELLPQNWVPAAASRR